MSWDVALQHLPAFLEPRCWGPLLAVRRGAARLVHGSTRQPRPVAELETLELWDEMPRP